MCRNRISQTLLLAGALILLVGGLLWRLRAPERELNITRDRFWALKTHSDFQVDMILIGDSRTYRGLSPSLMQTVLTDYRILNFAFSAGGLNPAMYREAEARLDPDSDHRAVVLGISPSALLSIVADNEHFLEWKYKDPWKIFLALRFFPAYQFLYPVDLSDVLNPAEDTGYREEYHDDGWVASWVVADPEAAPGLIRAPSRCIQVPPAPDSEGSVPHPEAIPDPSHRISTALVDALLDQTRTWTQQGIHVFALRLPTRADTITGENRGTGFDDQQLAAAFEAAGGVWFWIPPERYETLDGSHLGKQSAMQLSLDLAVCIQEWLEEKVPPWN